MFGMNGNNYSGFEGQQSNLQRNFSASAIADNGDAQLSDLNYSLLTSSLANNSVQPDLISSLLKDNDDPSEVEGSGNSGEPIADSSADNTESLASIVSALAPAPSSPLHPKGGNALYLNHHNMQSDASHLDKVLEKATLSMNDMLLNGNSNDNSNDPSRNNNGNSPNRMHANPNGGHYPNGPQNQGGNPFYGNYGNGGNYDGAQGQHGQQFWENNGQNGANYNNWQNVNGNYQMQGGMNGNNMSQNNMGFNNYNNGNGYGNNVNRGNNQMGGNNYGNSNGSAYPNLSHPSGLNPLAPPAQGRYGGSNQNYPPQAGNQGNNQGMNNQQSGRNNGYNKYGNGSDGFDYSNNGYNQDYYGNNGGNGDEDNNYNNRYNNGYNGNFNGRNNRNGDNYGNRQNRNAGGGGDYNNDFNNRYEDRGNRHNGNDRNSANFNNGNNNNNRNPVAAGNVARDSMVEEFRQTYGKSRQWELTHIQNHIVAFCQDQHGSRFIQQRLEIATPSEKQLVFDEIIPYAISLMTDVFGNYVIQKLFEYGLPAQCETLASLLMGQSLNLSMQMYGCRVIQKALEYVSKERLVALVSEFNGPQLIKCVHDQNGNHVIQKCIEVVSRVAKEAPTQEESDFLSARIQFIMNAFKGQVKELSMHPYGCRVIQRILEHGASCHKQAILDELRFCSTDLVQDQYGNYVIQHVMQHGYENDRNLLVKEVQSHLLEFSQHKFASNVVEKCLQYANKRDRDEMIWTIINVTFDLNSPVDAKTGHCVLESMVRDPYANYVVQKVIDVSDERQRAAILRYVKENIVQLRRYTYGKHIIVRLEKIINEKF